MSDCFDEKVKVVPPGSTIGILGSGQLGRMMSIAAKSMGYRVHIFSESQDSPAGQVSDLEVIADLLNLEAVESFAKQVDVVTVETENIPIPTFEAAGQFAAAYPGAETLRVSQNRTEEKQFLARHNIPTCEFAIVRSLEELQSACQSLMPSVLKTTTGGYDGKGQAIIRSSADVDAAWSDLKATEAILEQWIEYDFEFSIIGARSSSGEYLSYRSIRNDHQNQILDVSSSPSGLSLEAEDAASQIVLKIMEQLGTVGILTVEFFYQDGKVLVNEMAPRPHNSGHLTIEAHATSQFEQHVRAICNLPLGSTEQLVPAAMANVLGDLWSEGDPRWHAAVAIPNTKLHLYGKVGSEIGRKMGHLTSFAKTVEDAKSNVIKARDCLIHSRSVVAKQN